MMEIRNLFHKGGSLANYGIKRKNEKPDLEK